MIIPDITAKDPADAVANCPCGRGAREPPAAAIPTAPEANSLFGHRSGAISVGVSALLTEIITLGRTLNAVQGTSSCASMGQVRPTRPRKRSTAGSNSSTARGPGFGNLSNLQPDNSLGPENSDPNHTLKCDEPNGERGTAPGLLDS